MRFRLDTRTRIALALGVVAAVVALNRVTAPKPRVLGGKFSRCTVGGVQVPLGARTINAEALSVSMRNGKPGAVLAPPFKVRPGGAGVALPATLALGVHGSRPGTLTAVVVVQNSSSCPVAFTAAHVSARHSSAAGEETLVTFGGRNRIVLDPGHSTTGRAVLPATADGTWFVEANASADVGASA